jgi:hypothetical protein
MATLCTPRHRLNGFLARARRVLLTAYVGVALVSCGGGHNTSAAPDDGVSPAGADATDEPGIALNAPATVGKSSRISLSWQARGGLSSFTVFVQRAADQTFEAVDAVIAGQSAQFSRGAAYRWDFPTARVRVRGCSAVDQCVDSNEQPLVDVLLGGIAQLSADPFGDRYLGSTLSADGNTLVVIAPNAQCGPLFGAIVVYQRAADGHWTLEAALPPSAPRMFGFDGSESFQLSGDGNTLVVGSYVDNTVQVFVRDAQHNWSRQAYIQSSSPVGPVSFGEGVSIDHDGNRMVVTGQSSPNQIFVFEREAGQWRRAHLIEQGPGTSVYPPSSVAISPNGALFAVPVYLQSDNTFAVHVYESCSSCANGWQLAAELRSVGPSFESYRYVFGQSLSFSSDGKTLAVGDPGDSSNGGTMNVGSDAAGAVHIFAADDAGQWARRAFLKAKTVFALDALGDRVALSGDGKVLLAGACGLAANANGLRRNHPADATVGLAGGNYPQCERGGSGYVFEADGSGAWSHTAAAIVAPGSFLGGSAPGCPNCGFSLSMSADAETSAFAVLQGIGKPDRVVVH